MLYRTRTRAIATASLILIVALMAAACSSAASEETSATTVLWPERAAEAASTTTTTINPADAEIAAIEAAVAGAIESLLEAKSPPNPDDPRLAEYRTGAALLRVREFMREKQTARTGSRVPQNSQWSYSIQVEAFNDQTATVNSCEVDDVVVFDLGSKQVLNDNVSTKLQRYELVKIDDIWKVEGIGILQQWDGVTTCT